MAASSEGLSTVPNTPTNNSVNLEIERNASRSPSISSVKDFTWPILLSSKHKRNIKKIKGEYENVFLMNLLQYSHYLKK